MPHQFLMFLAPDSAAIQRLSQAAALKKPTVGSPQANPLDSTAVSAATSARVHQAKLLFCIAGNVIGLAGFIAGCWYCLQLLQAFL